MDPSQPRVSRQTNQRNVNTVPTTSDPTNTSVMSDPTDPRQTTGTYSTQHNQSYNPALNTDLPQNSAGRTDYASQGTDLPQSGAGRMDYASQGTDFPQSSAGRMDYASQGTDLPQSGTGRMDYASQGTDLPQSGAGRMNYASQGTDFPQSGAGRTDYSDAMDPTNMEQTHAPVVPPKDTTMPSSTAYTSNTPRQSGHTNPLDQSKHTGFNNEPSATQGLKTTIAGTIQKLAGTISGDDERKIAGDIKKQGGKQELRAAKEKHLNSIDQGHGRGDLEGTHVHDDANTYARPVGGEGYGAGNTVPQGYGRGDLGGAEVGQEPAFQNANVGKRAPGYARGDLGQHNVAEE